jgi:hypothetical protein
MKTVSILNETNTTITVVSTGRQHQLGLASPRYPNPARKIQQRRASAESGIVEPYFVHRGSRYYLSQFTEVGSYSPFTGIMDATMDKTLCSGIGIKYHRESQCDGTLVSVTVFDFEVQGSVCV